jgi:hypothetical protein
MGLRTVAKAGACEVVPKDALIWEAIKDLG